MRDLVVEVTDQQGKPLKDATVRYGLYNYAEFYPRPALPQAPMGALRSRPDRAMCLCGPPTG